MEQVIVAFESEKSCKHIRDLLEGSGMASCTVCRTADQVKRVAGSLRRVTVVCGYKFPDGTAEQLFEDLPPGCAMLMVAAGSLLELCRRDDILKLPAPVPKGELLAAVEALLREERQIALPPRRSAEEAAVLEQAKKVLMARRGMTEEQAHRFLQRKSMASGDKLVQTALLVLERQ